MNALIVKWLHRVIGSEGEYANRSPKDDPGGETKWGISKRSYPHLDIKNLTVEQASVIYEKDFIGPLLNKGIPDSIVFQLFDFGVHSGISRAVKALQKELGTSQDGIIGKITVGKIKEKSESDLVMLIVASRLEFMTGLPNWISNSKGWARRIATNLRYGSEDTE
jgi:lysozyme family protein